MCSGFDYSFSSGEVTFGYALRGERSVMEFAEKIRLPVPAVPPSDGAYSAASSVLRLAHAVAGVSYAKAAAVTTIEDPIGCLEAADADLLRGVYRDGMGEFAYTNNLPQVLHTEFELAPEQDRGYDEAQGRDYAAISPGWQQLPLGDRPLVACGGGKDSIVTIEALRRAGLDPLSFVVNPNEITTSVVERSGTQLLAVKRSLDPLLFEINASGAFNGHVPVTAINSLLGVVVTLLHGLGPVVMSNESSASVPNLQWHGKDINHQWSKGIDAERLVRAALAVRFGQDAHLYFSTLRHLNELSIAERFASIDGYDDVVTSCNRAFTITKQSGKRWCRDCPKCRFVFLALACFMPSERVIGIFGGDVLRDDTQLQGYRELLGLTAFKPFECVGELDESVAAVGFLAQQPQWKDATVITALSEELAASARHVPSLDSVLSERGPTLAPTNFTAAVDALARSRALHRTARRRLGKRP
jgi:hypothetical protein